MWIVVPLSAAQSWSVLPLASSRAILASASDRSKSERTRSIDSAFGRATGVKTARAAPFANRMQDASRAAAGDVADRDREGWAVRAPRERVDRLLQQALRLPIEQAEMGAAPDRLDLGEIGHEFVATDNGRRRVHDHGRQLKGGERLGCTGHPLQAQSRRYSRSKLNTKSSPVGSSIAVPADQPRPRGCRKSR